MFEIIVTYNENTQAILGDAYLLHETLYISFTLASTLLCMMLIVYSIVTVAHVVGQIRGGLKAYHHVIEILLESSALYSNFLILNLVFYARGDQLVYYFDDFAAITKV